MKKRATFPKVLESQVKVVCISGAGHQLWISLKEVVQPSNDPLIKQKTHPKFYKRRLTITNNELSRKKIR